MRYVVVATFLLLPAAHASAATVSRETFGVCEYLPEKEFNFWENLLCREYTRTGCLSAGSFCAWVAGKSGCYQRNNMGYDACRVFEKPDSCLHPNNDGRCDWIIVE